MSAISITATKMRSVTIIIIFQTPLIKLEIGVHIEIFNLFSTECTHIFLTADKVMQVE
jgi:hypothetical protein